MTESFPNRSNLTSYGSILALAAAFVAPSAFGQAFQGTPTAISGAPFITQGGTADTIEVTSVETVIDWRPSDMSGTGTIDFLPAGNTVTFREFGSASLTEYTVLNRILPTDVNGAPVSRIVALNGTVQSELNGSTGGSVWFYAPGGIIAGSSSVFNVGSLVLTSNTIDTSGGLYGSGGEIRFQNPVAGSASAVEVRAGAQITAPATGSYVALVAPRVVQAGTVNVNGSAAYVAAEAADIRINGGLFDIAITAGTTDENGVVHSGTTTGPASTDMTDAQRIFMVAVPKNIALTMLLSGSIGYTPAASAAQEGSGVVLSAGYDVSGGAIANAGNSTASAAGSIGIGAGDWQSDVVGAATGDISILSNAAPATHFLGNVFLSAESGITLRANQLGQIAADGDVTLNAGFGSTGGQIDLLTFGGSGSAANNGRIEIAGNLTLNANGLGNEGSPVGENGTGGTINIVATGGLIGAASLVANATGYAGYGSDRSGDATGGSITLSALAAAGPSGTEGGTLSFDSTSLDASAGTAFQVSTPPIAGGNAAGGTISLNGMSGVAVVGSLDLGAVTATAQATGGVASTGAAGNATGGNIVVNIARGTHQWASFYGDVSAAGGHATDGGSYGSVSPGSTGIHIDVGGTGSLDIMSSVSLYADGHAYGGGSGGGTVRAGQITISPHDGGSFTIAEDLYASAQTSGYVSSFPPSTFRTPDMIGGSIVIGAAGGTFVAGGLMANASASALNAPGTAGSATGGSVTLFASTSGGTRGRFTLSDCAGFLCRVAADGEGGWGATGANGTGGSILLYSSDADFSALGNLQLSTEGNGGASTFDGSSGRGGNGRGGSVTVESRTGTAGDATLTFGNLFASAAGSSAASTEGVFFNDGDGGSGTGGIIAFHVAGGSLTADMIDANASGLGGASAANCPTCEGGGTTAFRAGNGQGGSSTFLISGGSADIGTLTLSAIGTGGAADANNDPQSVAARAGTGRGGSAMLQSQGGTLRAGTIDVNAGGLGGLGSSAFQADGANGGLGMGGTARLLMDAGGTGQMSADSGILISAAGQGGDGASIDSDSPGTSYRAGLGGNGTGGTASVTIASGALTAPSILVSAQGIGGAGGDNASDGAGGDAGNGNGGTARLAYRSEGHAISTIMVQAEGLGGQAGSNRFVSDFDINGNPVYDFGVGAGGRGGQGTGGAANLLIDVDPAFASLTVNADGIGSAGGDGALGGEAGNGVGGIATLNLDFGVTTVSGAVRVSASGIGGIGGSGYDDQGGRGGDALGGTATFGLSDSATDLDASSIAVLAEALGGAGGAAGLRSGTGLRGADGGNATGGAALLAISTGAAATFRDSLRISGDAIGGAGTIGTAGTVGGAGGVGGNADAGSATLQIRDGRLLQTGSSSLQSNAIITAIGLGGAGASGSSGTNAGLSGGAGGNGGYGTGGTASFDASNGDYNIGGVAISADGRGGTAGAGGSGPGGNSANGTGGIGSGGGATFVNGGDAALAPGEQRLLDSLFMSASGTTSGNVTFTDEATAANGALHLNGAITLRSLGAPVAGFSGISLTATGQVVQAGGDADFASDGPLTFSFTNNGGLAAAGALTGYSGTRITLSHGSRPAASVSMAANTILLSSPGDVGILSAGSLQAADRIRIQSLAGDLHLGNGSMLAAGGDLSLFAQGSVDGTNTRIRAAGSLAVHADGIGQPGAGSLSIGEAVAGNALTLTGRAIDAQRLISGGATLLNAGIGSLSVADILSTGPITANGGDISLGSTGNMTIAQAVASGGPVTLNAAGSIDILGAVNGQTIAIGSSDIGIASGAQVGTSGMTHSVAFTSLNIQAPAYVGGVDIAGAYSLSAAELMRVMADAITVSAPDLGTAGTPDLILGQLTLGTSNLPDSGVLTLATPGLLRVTGAVRLTGRSGQGGLTLTAGDALEVIAGSGSIDISDASGGLGGVLTLGSPRITAATASAILDLASLSSLIAREERLAQNDGVLSDGGLLRAGIIRANVTDGFYVQNTGVGVTFSERRGFTANGLFITTQGSPTQIAINGQLLQSPGLFATGLDTIPQVSINGALGGRAGGFAAGSKINGCLIASTSCIIVPFDNHDTWDALLDPAVTVTPIFSPSLIELREVVTHGYPPLIDEPVTGAGNEDLWQRDCGAPNEPTCADSPAP